MKKLVSKDPKCREPVNIPWQEAKIQIFIGLYEYIGELSSNKGISSCNFCEWKNWLISAIDDKKKKKLKIK